MVTTQRDSPLLNHLGLANRLGAPSLNSNEQSQEEATLQNLGLRLWSVSAAEIRTATNTNASFAVETDLERKKKAAKRKTEIIMTRESAMMGFDGDDLICSILFIICIRWLFCKAGSA